MINSVYDIPAVIAFLLISLATVGLLLLIFAYLTVYVLPVMTILAIIPAFIGFSAS